MKNIIDLLKEQFGSEEFGRLDVWDAVRGKVKNSEIHEFLKDESNKVRRGVYKLAGNAKAEVKIVESDFEIEQRITDRFEILELMAQCASIGQTRALIVSGPPGLGKTHTINQVVKKHSESVSVISGTASAVGLYKALYESKDHGQVLIIDDCDSVFFDQAALNVLKAACDSTKQRTLRWCTEYFSKNEDFPSSFDYNGTVIFITNLDFDSMIAKQTKMAPHLEALMSRAHYLDLGIKNRRDYIIRIRQVIKSMVDSKAEQKELVDYIEANTNNLRELSIRTVVKLAQLKNSSNDWKRIASVTMCCKN